MARIVFVQPLPYEYPGTQLLSACLKAGGHQAGLVIDADPDPRDREFAGVDLVAISLMTGYVGWALGVAKKLKAATGARVVLGGPHPTHCPEVIEAGPVDAVCRGEGEEAFVSLADGIDRGVWDTAVENMWVKEGGVVHQNPMRPPVADLDSLPPPDRELYYSRYPHLARAAQKPFQAGRGCPFDCVFCSNAALRKLYGGHRLGVRLKSPERLVEEIIEVRDRYGLQGLVFHDDTFTVDGKWAARFLELYRARVGLPFSCQSRADAITGNLAAKLKAAGCRSVSFAVETGVERIRREVLNKNLTDAKIREGAKFLKDAGIALATYNLIGIPGETLGDALATVRMNVEIGADYPRCSFPTPYPGTRLLDLAREKGFAPDELEVSPLSQQLEAKFTGEETRAFTNLHSLFQTAVLFSLPEGVVKTLVRLPLGPLYRAWWALTYAWVFMRSEGRNPLDQVRFAAYLARQRLALFSRSSRRSQS